MAYCPNCADEIAIDAPRCPTCEAVFVPGSAWQPLTEAPAERDLKRIAEWRAISERRRLERARASNRENAKPVNSSRIYRTPFVPTLIIGGGLLVQLMVLDSLLQEHFWPSTGGGWLGSALSIIVGLIAAVGTLVLAASTLSAVSARFKPANKGRFFATLCLVAVLLSILHLPAVFYILNMPDPSVSRGSLSLIEYIYLRRSPAVPPILTDKELEPRAKVNLREQEEMRALRRMSRSDQRLAGMEYAISRGLQDEVACLEGPAAYIEACKEQARRNLARARPKPPR
jgi:uncharacterized membrane protein YhaH (DUF805 family)